MRARIFPNTKTSTQSGKGRDGGWELAFMPTEPERNDPLMGWWGSGDMQAQVRLHFPTRDDAIAYAERHAIPFDLELPAPRRIPMKVYADNFRFGRSDNWTH